MPHYRAENWICNTLSTSEPASSRFSSLYTASEIAAYSLHPFTPFVYCSFCVMKQTYESVCVYCDCLWLLLAASSSSRYLIILWVYHLNLLHTQVQSKWSLLPHPIFQKKFSCTINLMRSLPTPLWLLNVVCVGTRPLDFIMVCMHVRVVR